MKVKYKEQIGDYTIIRFIADAVVDSEATKQKIESLITPEMTGADVENLFNNNLVYAKVGDEADLISDELGEQLQSKLDDIGEHQLLLDSGDYLDDYRGVEYWIENAAGKWEKQEIEEVGITLPAEAVLPENLTPGQSEIIFAQQEADQIAAMSEEDKANAKQIALDSLADEADRLDRRAKIQQQPFDSIVWYREHADAIELKYA